ncbi:hypothetical protein ACGTN9_11660 [Halobacillus sp. MO56]
MSTKEEQVVYIVFVSAIMFILLAFMPNGGFLTVDFTSFGLYYLLIMPIILDEPSRKRTRRIVLTAPIIIILMELVEFLGRL